MVRPGIRTFLGLGCLLAVAVLLTAAVLATANALRLADPARRLHQSAAVLGDLERLLSTLEGAEADLQDDLRDGWVDDLEDHKAALAAIDHELQSLTAGRDDPERRGRLQILAAKVREHVAALR